MNRKDHFVCVCCYLDTVGGVADLLGSGSGGVGRCVGVCDLAGTG